MAAVDAPHVADADLARTAPITSAAASDAWWRAGAPASHRLVDP